MNFLTVMHIYEEQVSSSTQHDTLMRTRSSDEFLNYYGYKFFFLFIHDQACSRGDLRSES